MKKLLITLTFAACLMAAACNGADSETPTGPPPIDPGAAYMPANGLASPSPLPTVEPSDYPGYSDGFEHYENGGETGGNGIETNNGNGGMHEPAATEQPATAAPTPVPQNITNPFPATFMSPYDANGNLLTAPRGWGFVRNTDNQPPPLRGGNWGFDIRPFNARHLGDLSGNYIYLTFDLGYEYRFTPIILDILAEHNVPAAFFITGGYLIQNPELVRRMVDEGHIVANHGRFHASNPTLNEEQLTFEIMEVCRLFTEFTGEVMPRFYRPAYGEYSAFSLHVTQQLGWQTVFWSMAWVDWHTNNQPGRDYVISHIQTNIHPGAIILMHTVSESNTEALPYMIEWLRGEGYVFKPLYGLGNS